MLLCIALHHKTSLAQPAMETLKKTLVNYKISSLAGEDVTKATSVIRASLNLLRSASMGLPDGAGTYVPDKLPLVICKILATTSVPQFNEPYLKMVTDAENAMDMPMIDDFGRISTARHISPVVADVDLLLTGADNK